MTTTERQNFRKTLFNLGFVRVDYSPARDPKCEIYTETWKKGLDEVLITWGPKTPELPPASEEVIGQLTRVAAASRAPRICGCFCHNDGLNILHMIPCCDLTYTKYADANGVIDRTRLIKARQPETDFPG